MLTIMTKIMGEFKTIGWHTGEPVPALGRVAQIVADGDELEMIVYAMQGLSAVSQAPTGLEPSNVEQQQW